jgi:hypothetical protein
MMTCLRKTPPAIIEDLRYLRTTTERRCIDEKGTIHIEFVVYEDAWTIIVASRISRAAMRRSFAQPFWIITRI